MNGLTLPLQGTYSCSSRSLRTPSLKADGLSAANRLASVTPPTLNPTCQLHAMTYSCAPRRARRGGRAIAFIIKPKTAKPKVVLIWSIYPPAVALSEKSLRPRTLRPQPLNPQPKNPSSKLDTPKPKPERPYCLPPPPP